MQTNLNDYDRRTSWVPPQSQPYTSRFVPTQNGEPQFALPPNLASQQRPVNQKTKAPEKMPKARAMALANRFKRGFAIASIIGFGAFGGLVALHQVGTTSTQATQTSSGSSSSNSSKSSNSSNSTNSSSSSSQSSNNFFGQQGGNTSGTSSSSSSSSSNSSNSSSTVSGTHTS